MSIVIEQTQAEAQDAYAFSRHAEIIGVRAVSASFSSLKPFSNESSEELEVGFRFSPEGQSITERSFQATTAFECWVSNSSDSVEEDPILKFQCSFAATYQLREGYEPSEAEIAAFQKGNVVFNSWPFFREFVQNSASRMNIPPPPIPFVRVQVCPEPNE